MQQVASQRISAEQRVEHADSQLFARACSQAELIAEVIEAELVAGAVNDLLLIGRRLSAKVVAFRQQRGGQAKHLEDWLELQIISLSEVRVRRRDMRLTSAETREKCWDCRNESLPFAGRHLDDLPVRQSQSREQLHAVIFQSERASNGFADNRRTDDLLLRAVFRLLVGIESLSGVAQG